MMSPAKIIRTLCLATDNKQLAVGIAASYTDVQQGQGNCKWAVPTCTVEGSKSSVARTLSTSATRPC